MAGLKPCAGRGTLLQVRVFDASMYSLYLMYFMYAQRGKRSYYVCAVCALLHIYMFSRWCARM
jgi:hypothetical protein